jgi:hypothetical protein
VLQARPHFTENCTKWVGAVTNEFGQAVPDRCQLQALSHWETMRLINDSVIMFIGDSTARRAALQLRTMLANTTFSDVMKEDGSYHSTVLGEVSDSSVGFSAMVMSLWYPHIADLADDLNNGSFSHWPFLRALNATSHYSPLHKWRSKRKIIVMHYSSWDLRHGLRIRRWYEDLPAFFDRFVGNLTHTMALVKHQYGVHMSRDMMLLRLPIAHGCEFGKVNKLPFQFGCNRSKTRVDPVNDRISELAHRMQKAVADAHPDVGMIDVFSWTRSQFGAGRNVCTPSDNKGIHFSTDEARQAYVQQVLFGVKLYSTGFT